MGRRLISEKLILELFSSNWKQEEQNLSGEINKIYFNKHLYLSVIVFYIQENFYYLFH